MTVNISPRDTTKYQGPSYQLVASYMRNRDPTTADLFPKENLGKYPVISLWTNKTLNKLWGLVNIVNNKAIWVLIASSSGGNLETLTPDTGAAAVPDGSQNINIVGQNAPGSTGSGITTFTNPAFPNSLAVQMQSPFSLSPFTFIQNVGINTPASSNPSFPLIMINNLSGNYSPTLINSSTADNTTASWLISNGVENMLLGMGSSGYVSNPVLQNNAFIQTGSNLVFVTTTPGDAIQFWSSGTELGSFFVFGGQAQLQLFDAYLNLANQSFINSFQNLSFTVANGATRNLVIIGSNQHWQFFASTANTTPDTAYRAAATVLSFQVGANTVDNYVTSNLTFGTVGNQVQITNAGPASRDLIVSGLRIA